MDMDTISIDSKIDIVFSPVLPTSGFTDGLPLPFHTLPLSALAHHFSLHILLARRVGGWDE